MWKQLKKGVARVGGIILALAGGLPDNGWTFIGQVVNHASSSPVRTILVVVGVALILYSFKDRILNALGIRTVQRLESDVRSWLDAFEYSVKRIPRPKAHFEFQVTPEDGPPFIVGNYLANEHYLLISGGVGFLEEDRAVYFSLSELEQNLIGSKAIMELCRTSVAYDINLLKEKARIFKRVPITADLSEHVLMTAIDELASARSLFGRSLTHSMLEVRKRLELPPTKEKEGETKRNGLPDVAEVP